MNLPARMVCAHYISNYLFTTMNWLYPILQPAADYDPIVFARQTSNLGSFPVRRLFALTALHPVLQGMNLTVYKTAGYFPLFHRAAKKSGVELMHAHFGYDGYKMLPLKKKLGVPMITGFYGLDASKYLRSAEWREKYRVLFQEGELFLALGPRMQEALVQAGCPKEKIRIHNLGIAVEDFPFCVRQLPPGGVARLIMGASFREKKGIAYALEAAALLRDRRVNFHLVIAGDGELRPQIERQIARLNLSRHVELPGYVEPHAFRKMMEQAHILILPSVTASDGDMEGTPFVLIEALAMGMPVISTYHADIPEIVQDGVNGFLVPERDSAALADRLIHLIEHPEIWEPMGNAGRAHISAHFNAGEQFQKLLQIYAQMCGRTPQHT